MLRRVTPRKLANFRFLRRSDSPPRAGQICQTAGASPSCDYSLRLSAVVILTAADTVWRSIRTSVFGFVTVWRMLMLPLGTINGGVSTIRAMEEARENFEKSANSLVFIWTSTKWARAFAQRMDEDPEWPNWLPARPVGTETDPEPSVD